MRLNDPKVLVNAEYGETGRTASAVHEGFARETARWRPRADGVVGYAVAFPFFTLPRAMSNTESRPVLHSHTSVSRRDGRLVIEIPEHRVLTLASELYGDRAIVSDEERLLDQVAAALARPGRSGREGGEAPLDRLVGDLLAEAAHAKAGLQWKDPAQHTLIHE